MKRLYRSRTNRVLAGVCGGIGEYFDIDPMIVRLLWIVFSFSGVGIIAYILAMFIIPDSMDSYGYNYNDYNIPVFDAKKTSMILGIILIVVGLYFFLEKYIPWLDFRDLWPLLLVVAGGMLIFRTIKNK